VAVACPKIVAAPGNSKHSVFHFPAIRLIDAIGKVRTDEIRPSSLLQRARFFVEKLHTFSYVGHGVLPVVFVLDGEHSLELLTMQFLQYRLDVTNAGSP
jgi:hypothetical protein